MLLNTDSVRVHTDRSAKKVLRASVAHTPSTASFLHSKSTGKLCRVERNHALKRGEVKAICNMGQSV